MIPKKKNRSKKVKRCSVCIKWKTKEEISDSGSNSQICNECFEPYKKILELDVGDPVVYISPGNTALFQESEITVKAHQRGNTWYAKIRPVGTSTEGLLTFVKYLRTND